MTFPVIAAPEWSGAQASPWVPVNEAIRRLIAGFSRAIVVDRDLTAPPGSCADGACYLVGASATDDWDTRDGELAIAVGTDAANGWLFVDVEREGFTLYLQDEDAEIRWDGAAWASGSGGPSEASAAEIWTGAATAKYVSPDKMFDAAAPQTLTSSSNITAVDLSAGINFNLTLGENSTLADPTNAKPGQSGRIRVTQDATGSRTLAFGSNWQHVGAAPTIATVGDAIDLFAYFVNTSSDIELSYLGTLV